MKDMERGWTDDVMNLVNEFTKQDGQNVHNQENSVGLGEAI